MSSSSDDVDDFKPPLFVMSPMEKGLFVSFGIVYAVLAVVGGVYYYAQWTDAYENPSTRVTRRILTNNEAFPAKTMSIIPLVYVLPSENPYYRMCQVTGDAWTQFVFGWGSKLPGMPFSVRILSQWKYVEGFWVTTFDLPFEMFFNSSGSYVRFQEPWLHGKQCHKEEFGNAQECPSEPTVMPSYAFFKNDEFGLECASHDRTFLDLSQSGLFVQFGSEQSDTEGALARTAASSSGEPAAYLAQQFPGGAFIHMRGSGRFPQPVFKLRTEEKSDIDLNIHTEIITEIQFPPGAARSAYNTDMTYWMVAMSPQIVQVQQFATVTMVSAMTAFFTSANTLLAVLTFFFTNKPSVPFHFICGKPSSAYKKAIEMAAEGKSDGLE